MANLNPLVTPKYIWRYTFIWLHKACPLTPFFPIVSLLQTRWLPKDESARAESTRATNASRGHEWLNAIESYTKAIEMYDRDPSYYCNRAQVILPGTDSLLGTSIADVQYPQANIKLEQYGYAIADAAKAIELDPGYAKVRDDSPHRRHSRWTDVVTGVLPESSRQHRHPQLPCRRKGFQRPSSD